MFTLSLGGRLVFSAWGVYLVLELDQVEEPFDLVPGAQLRSSN